MNPLTILIDHIDATTDRDATGTPAAGTDDALAGLTLLINLAHGCSIYSATGGISLGSAVELRSDRFGVKVVIHEPTPHVVNVLRSLGARDGSAVGARWLRWDARPSVHVVAFLADGVPA